MRTHRTLARACLALALLCLGSPGRSPAAGPAPPTVDEVIARWVQALGGKKALRGVRCVHVRSDSTESGVAGTSDQWISRDGFRRTTAQERDTREEVCLRGSCWIKDWNGKVLDLAGRDRRDQVTVAYLESLLFAGAASGAAQGAGARLLGQEEARGRVVIRFTPADGVPFDLSFDAATFLPVEAVRKPYDDAITVKFTDWRRVDGVIVPFSLRVTGGEGNGDDTTQLRDVRVNAPLPPKAFDRPKDGAKDFRFAHGDRSSGIPFNFENDHIMVPCRVNGSEPIWFLLDTGAEATIINIGRMKEFGLQPFGATSVTGGGNSAPFSFTRVASLRVGDAELAGQRDGVMDLSGLERIYGMPMGGLLGYDFLSRFVVEVDYVAKTIALYDPAAHAYAGSGERVPFIMEEGHPHVASRISVPGAPPIDADMVLDCGAADTVNLASPFVKAHRLLELARSKPAGAPNTMAGSEKEFFAQTSVRGRISAITLGGFTVSDVPINLMMGTTGAYASLSFSGTIGEGVLRRFKTIYDYSRRVMVLEPNADFGTPFAGRKTFGATFLADGSDYTVFTVTGVRKASPAEAAGLETGDVVVALDGRPAKEFRLADLRRALSADGTRHVLGIRRSGGDSIEIQVMVTLISLDET
jgi:hypothetical protein